MFSHSGMGALLKFWYRESIFRVTSPGFINVPIMQRLLKQ